MLPLQVRVDQAAITIKMYSTFPKSLGLSLCRDAVGVFYSHSWLGCLDKEHPPSWKIGTTWSSFSFNFVLCKSKLIRTYHHNWVRLIAWICLTLSHHPSLSTGPLDDIQCRHKTDDYKSLPVGQHWYVCNWELTGEFCLCCDADKRKTRGTQKGLIEKKKIFK